MTSETRRLLWIYLGFVAVTVGVVIFFQVCSPPVHAQGTTRKLEWDSPRSAVNPARYHNIRRRFYTSSTNDPLWSDSVTVDINCVPKTARQRSGTGEIVTVDLWHCTYSMADKDYFYSVSACNNAGCSDWVEEPLLSCGPIGGAGCPCGTWPSPPGCIP